MKFSIGQSASLILFVSGGLFRLAAAQATVTSSSSGWMWMPPAIGILVGGLLIFMSIVEGRKGKASLQWPSVQGTVLSSELVLDSSGEASTYTPTVTYAYVVNGRPLTCAKVQYSSTTSKKVLAKYPKGSAVQVFYDPQAPSTAVLERGGSTRGMMFGGIAVAVGGCLIGSMMR